MEGERGVAKLQASGLRGNSATNVPSIEFHMRAVGNRNYNWRMPFPSILPRFTPSLAVGPGYTEHTRNHSHSG